MTYRETYAQRLEHRQRRCEAFGIPNYTGIPAPDVHALFCPDDILADLRETGEFKTPAGCLRITCNCTQCRNCWDREMEETHEKAD